MSRGRIHRAASLPGFIALRDQKPVGLVTFEIEGDSCEIISLNVIVRGEGIGSALLGAVEDKARELKCRRVWLVTTNDNCDALSFYQRRGYKIAAVYLDAVTQSRKLKPEIPEIGLNGIPVRDEIEFYKVM